MKTWFVSINYDEYKNWFWKIILTIVNLFFSCLLNFIVSVNFISVVVYTLRNPTHDMR